MLPENISMIKICIMMIHLIGTYSVDKDIYDIAICFQFL